MLYRTEDICVGENEFNVQRMHICCGFFPFPDGPSKIILLWNHKQECRMLGCRRQLGCAGGMNEGSESPCQFKPCLFYGICLQWINANLWVPQKAYLNSVAKVENCMKKMLEGNSLDHLVWPPAENLFQDLVKLSLECFQRRRFHHLSGQPYFNV